MATEVDIVNSAIANLGSASRVTSISPPDGSKLAADAAIFYPIVRNTLIEMREWPFVMSRAELSERTGVTIPPPFTHAYSMPSKAVVPLSVRRFDASDDSRPNIMSWEMLEDGTRVVFTDTDRAVMRFKVSTTDTTKYTPLFVEALTWGLSAKLVGGLLGGDAKQMERCANMYAMYVNMAVDSVFNAVNVPVEHTPSWIEGR